MGFFYSRNRDCPRCGEILEFQNKQGDKDSNFDGEEDNCSKCGIRYVLKVIMKPELEMFEA